MDCRGAWPDVEAVAFEHGSLAVPAAEALCDLIRNRSAARPHTADGETIRQFKSVTFENFHIPEWLEDQIDALLRLDAPQPA